MDGTISEKIFLDLSVGETEFNFSTSIADAIVRAEAELVDLNETVDSIKGLKPDCDKLDYILAASSGALCGIIDIFLVGKPGESPLGDIQINGLQPERWTLQSYAIQIKRILIASILH